MRAQQLRADKLLPLLAVLVLALLAARRLHTFRRRGRRAAALLRVVAQQKGHRDNAIVL